MAYAYSAVRSARLNREFGLPPNASQLPPSEHYALAQRHAREALLLAEGAEYTPSHQHFVRSWQQAHNLMAARTTQQMLHAASTMLESSDWHVHRFHHPAEERDAHAAYASYKACRKAPPGTRDLPSL
jgi:hypothetical protein